MKNWRFAQILRVSSLCLIFFVRLSLQLKEDSSVSRKTNVDDSISYTDYLIAIYSASEKKPCVYFSPSRFSQPETSIVNCTWYKSNACCKRTEVASVFLSMYTLFRASQHCMNLMNYMMCYFCSPEQFIWYRNNQVSICSSFCEEIYDNCKEAEYTGYTFGEVYKDGRAFCEAQDFKVIDSNHQCFTFDSMPFSRASNRNFNHEYSFILCFLFLLYLKRIRNE